MEIIPLLLCTLAAERVVARVRLVLAVLYRAGTKKTHYKDRSRIYDIGKCDSRRHMNRKQRKTVNMLVTACRGSSILKQHDNGIGYGSPFCCDDTINNQSV